MAHPVLAAATEIERALDGAAAADPMFMNVGDKGEALRRLVQLESRLAELRLRVMAASADVAAETGSRDVADWLVQQTHVRFEDARADERLAVALERRWTSTAAALRAGRVSVAQAQAVVRVLDDLPDDEVGADVVARAETALLEHAATLGPRQLASLGRRILELVAPEVADEAEARRLTALESEARRRTRLSLHRLGDGTTRVSGLVPDAAAARLATYLAAFTSPRRATDATDAGQDAAASRRPCPRRLGEAFCSLLEAVDPARLPLHGGDATTVVIAVPLTALRTELATAEIVGPEEIITAAQARRLACTAGLVPAVLGAASEVLDLGRTRRLFSPAQRRALLVRDRTCRAEGCTIPGTWCEAHHRRPWSRGGSTDLADGLLLCSHHHHRAHDPGYTSERLPDGDVRYHRRT